eukprot:6189209-Pleurochrysis_carterae.AAC.1
MAQGKSYIPTHRLRSYTLARTPHTHDGDASGRASEREILPTHHPLLGIFCEGCEEHGRSSQGTGGQEEPAGRPAPECGGSIGSTRPVGPKDPEGEGSWLRQKHTPIEDLGACELGGGRPAPPAPAPSPTFPGKRRRARPCVGRTLA